MKKYRIGVLSIESPFDRSASSGTRYKMVEQLQLLGYDIIWLKVERPNVLLWRVIVKFLSVITGRKFLLRQVPYYASKYTKTIDKKLIESCDVLMVAFFAGVCYALNTNKKIIYFSDATFHIMEDFYLKNLSGWSRKQGNNVELCVLNKVSHIIVSSQWAYDSVIEDYGISPYKVSVIEFGANIDEKDIVNKNFEYTNCLHILFLGVNWMRKGGDIAVEAVKWLNKNGVRTILHIVGIKEGLENYNSFPYLKNYGFLNKNIKEQYVELVKIIQMSHCLLLPTMAECAGIAFCEASANGLPSFSHKIGGIPNYVINGKNGYLLPIGSSGEDFGIKIKECLISGEMARMSKTAKQIYNERLNWGVWRNKVQEVIENL